MAYKKFTASEEMLKPDPRFNSKLAFRSPFSFSKPFNLIHKLKSNPEALPCIGED